MAFFSAEKSNFFVSFSPRMTCADIAMAKDDKDGFFHNV